MTDKFIVGNSEYKPGYKILSPEEIIAKYSKPEQKGSSNVRKQKTIETKVEENKVQENQEEKTSFDSQDFIYVPSISLYVAKQRSFLGLDWNSCQEQLHKENSKMPTIPEFKEFLNYTKINFPEIYSEITEMRNPWRGEWLDADFKFENNELFVYYHVFENNKIIKKKEKLDKDTLMQINKTPGISLDSWLNNFNSTKQGLPKSNIDSGSLYYWSPGKDNVSVARFYALLDRFYFDCVGDISDQFSNLGVRVAKQKL